MIDLRVDGPGVYYFDGRKLTRVFSCHECNNSARHKILKIAREIEDLKIRNQLIGDIEREEWSGAGYD